MKTEELVIELKGEMFRAAVFADTHGNSDYMTDVVRNQGPFDLLVHLGDGNREFEKMLEMLNFRGCCVRGNEDFGSRHPERRIIRVNGVGICAMHGHQLDMNPYHSKDVWEGHFRDLSGIAVREGADALFFGHSHKPALRNVDGILVCNPGNHYRGSVEPAGYAGVTIRSGEIGIALYKRIAENVWEMDQQITQRIQVI